MLPPQKIIITLSALLALMVSSISLVGVYTPNFYARETPNWQAQSFGQDIIDLVLIVPALLITAQITRKSLRTGKLLWAGVLLYLSYTFTIYSFDVHFNKLFVLYCFTLGFSFYLFFYSTYSCLQEQIIIKSKSRIARKFIGIYFMTIAILFYLLWLAEIIPATVTHTTPKILLEVGLPTNPVHVIDLSIVLPGIFITGILLLKDKKTGHLLTPVILIFFILMDITIGSLSLIMKLKGFEGSFTLTMAMFILALLSITLLIWYLRNQQVEVTNPVHA